MHNMHNTYTYMYIIYLCHSIQFLDKRYSLPFTPLIPTITLQNVHCEYILIRGDTEGHLEIL